jgi:hypothetical protein
MANFRETIPLMFLTYRCLMNYNQSCGTMIHNLDQKKDKHVSESGCYPDPHPEPHPDINFNYFMLPGMLFRIQMRIVSRIRNIVNPDPYCLNLDPYPVIPNLGIPRAGNSAPGRTYTSGVCVAAKQAEGHVHALLPSGRVSV